MNVIELHISESHVLLGEVKQPIQFVTSFLLPFQDVFENSDKILTFVSLRVDVNFETFADAFSLMENSYKFLPIL